MPNASRSLLPYGLALSLFLHALFLLLPGGAEVVPPADKKAAPALHMRLAGGVVVDNAANAAPVGDVAARKGAPLGSGHVEPSWRVQRGHPPASDVPVPAAPSVDQEKIRSEARRFARELYSGGGLSGKDIRRTPDLLDQPVLPALARHLREPLTEAREQVLADGGRMIRFTGNRCLHIPRDLVVAGRGGFGTDILVPTNCPK